MHYQQISTVFLPHLGYLDINHPVQRICVMLDSKCLSHIGYINYIIKFIVAMATNISQQAFITLSIIKHFELSFVTLSL